MKKTTKIVTFAGIPLLVILILVYDVIAIGQGGTEASISSLIITMSYEFPALPFGIGLLIGFLCGHLFWRMKSNKDTLSIDHLKK